MHILTPECFAFHFKPIISNVSSLNLAVTNRASYDTDYLKNSATSKSLRLIGGTTPVYALNIIDE